MAILTASPCRYRANPRPPRPQENRPPDPRLTRVVLPKKKPLKWSTGVAPDEYGGPPTTTKLRKYWGGQGDEDPVTATDDFIWNEEFVDGMKKLIRDDGAAPNPLPLVEEDTSSEFLSLNRAMSLDRALKELHHRGRD